MNEIIEQRLSGRVIFRGEIRGGCFSAELALAANRWATEVGLSHAKEGARRVYDIPASLLPDLLESLDTPLPLVSPDVRARLAPLLALAAAQREDHLRFNASACTSGLSPVEDDALLPFQRTGVAWLLRNGGVGLVADDMGLGKTAQALAWMRHAQIRRAVVVAPASVALNWCREAQRFFPQARGVAALSPSALDAVLAAPPSEPMFVVVTWDGLRRMWSSLLALKPQALVADEAHYAKSLDAQRTRALLWLASSVPHRILLSGTPLRNRPRELFPLLHVLDPVRFRSFVPFGERYCGAKMQRFGARHVRTYDGASHAEELNLLIRPYLIRRNKLEVLDELPPKRVQRLCLPEIPGVRRKLKSAMLVLSTEQHEGGQRGLGLITQIRQEVGLAKVEAAQEWIASMREAGEAAVVFCHHLSVLDALVAACEKSGWRIGRIAGDTPAATRQQIVADFQADKIDLVLATEAAREGITLTRAANLLFCEYFWVPGDMSQASDRIWRIGQRREALITILHLEGSLDDHVARVIERKSRIIETVQDNRSVEAEIIRELLENSP